MINFQLHWKLITDWTVVYQVCWEMNITMPSLGNIKSQNVPKWLM